jgi:hypothetical protein
MTPFYRHLTGFAGGIDVDKAGLVAAGLVGVGLAAHGLVRLGARFTKKPEAKPEHEEAEKGGAP